MKNLTIYKASAGSGKTYRLVREYILLLFKNRFNFRHILAVTFTNKATAEMKSKVVYELFLLSKDDKEGLKSEHRQAVKDTYPLMNEAEIMKTAGTILSLILNNYSHFFISTIDRFFQYIIKSFSKELGIFNNYNLQLDNTSILTEAVEQLFIQLEDSDQGELLNWLTNYAESRVEEGEKYDITADIIRLGYELFREGFKTEKKALFKALEDKDALKAILANLKKQIRLLENEFEAFGTKGLELVENFGLELSDFKYGKTSGINVFKKLKNKEIDKSLLIKRTLSMAEDDDMWVSKSSEYFDAVCTARDNGLKTLLLDFITFYDEHYETLQSLKAIARNFFTLGIFVDLQQAVKNYTEEHNLLLLSDSNELIDTIIGDNDTPFIYEKAGNKFGYFMIDEFQDTSDMQWKNFKPLISNSLAFGNPNLLVGDVKQSIYRWRNSNWQLLAETIYNEFPKEQIENLVLGENWRSSEYIVRFNNFIFNQAPAILQQTFNSVYPTENKIWESMITNAYDTHHQNIMHKDENGYVYFKNFGKNDEFDTEDVFKHTVSLIEDAQKRGFAAGDIAVLVRKNREGSDFIKYLLNYKLNGPAKPELIYDVISSDSLVLGSSDALVFIMNLLKLETEPENPLLIAEINFFNTQIQGDPKNPFNPFNGQKVVLQQVVKDKLTGLEMLSLKEKTDAIIQRFQLESDPQQIIFIEAFRDVLNEYIKRNASDLYGFINHWEDIKNKSSVQPSKTENAIQVMTIHKAKGLEFPVVILPFANWNMDMDKNTNVAWCQVPERLQLPLPVVPVQLTGALKETVFKDTLMEEQLMTNIDNLNLLYVALTRAKTELYVLGSLQHKNNATTLLEACIQNSPETVALNTHDDGFTDFGSKKQKRESEKIVTTGDTIMLSGLAGQSKSTPVIRKVAPHIFSGSETDLMAKAHTGTHLHEVFRQSKTLDELKRNIDKQVREGKFNREEGEKLKTIITEKFKDPMVQNWFSDTRTILNEISVRQGEHEWRPDKVILNDSQVQVIDYKFGGIEDVKYHRQVNAYKHILKKMGYANVKGYLWYVAMDKIAEVI